jgi:N-hydroxyarylamine O-acetyltransferase
MSSIDGVRQVDLDAYCARIGYDGPREPTLAVLRDLHRLHPAAIPFEAIDVLLGRPVSLAPAAVDAKLIAGRRGGYCFEQNSLLRRALQAMGFQVGALIARSWWGRTLAEPRPRTHLALRVTLEGEAWLADVGYSAVTLTAPVRLAARAPQETLFEPVRLTPVGEELRYEVEIGAEWRPVYDIAASPPLDADLMAANWFTSTHPDSVFRHVLMVCRTTAEARWLLAANRLTVCRPGGETERRTLSADALEACLAGDFGLSPEPAWRPFIERAGRAGDGTERRG